MPAASPEKMSLLMAARRLSCILPPYLLRNLYTNGPAWRQRDLLECMVDTARLRGRREARDYTLSALSGAAAGRSRRVYSAENGNTLPGKLVRSEGDPASSDPAVNEAYDGAGLTYDLFWRVYERDSLDGHGMTLNSTVHYQRAYDNAFWDGTQMVYGDGDGDLFNRFTLAVDVIGHELTHGVTEHTCNLTYSGQPGALNESWSDVFGSLVKQWQRTQTASEADWLIGQGLFTAKVSGVGLRSMKDPGAAYDDPILGKDPQPGHMRDYVVTLEDGGGVHINSGIPNHAFFLTATAMGGPAWEKAGRIWYLAARDRFSSNTDFRGAASLTHAVAGEVYGPGSDEQKAVQYGWESVGIAISADTPPAPQANPSGCLTAPLSVARAFWSRVQSAASSSGQALKIHFVRTGGFAGLRLAMDIDTDDLGEQEAAQLAELVEVAQAALADAPRSRSAPDQFEYWLTMGAESGEQATYSVCEPDVPEAVRPLLEQLTAMARAEAQLDLFAFDLEDRVFGVHALRHLDCDVRPRLGLIHWLVLDLKGCDFLLEIGGMAQEVQGIADAYGLGQYQDCNVQVVKVVRHRSHALAGHISPPLGLAYPGATGSG